MAGFISNEKILILDVIDDGPSIKLLGQLQSRETSQYFRDKVQELCFTNQDLARLPISQITIGTIAVAQVNVKSSLSFYRVQIIDNKRWNSGLLTVLLIDEFKWNFNIPFTNLFIAPPNVLELKMSSETFYLADVSPLCLNAWSDNCINVLKGQLIKKAVNGTVFREQEKVALFRPYEPNDQGQLLAKTMVQCGMAYITPSFPGLSPFPNQSSSFLSNKFVENSFLFPPSEQYVSSMVTPQSYAYPLAPVSFACLQQGNAFKNSSVANIDGNSCQMPASCKLVEKYNRFSKPVLQPGFQDMGRVTFIETGPWKFCLKLKSHQFYENNLEKQIQRGVAGNLNSISTFEMGMSVLCKTDKYCRGLIVGMDDYSDGKVKVFLIDFGSTEDIHINNIWSVPQDLYEIPMLVCRCCLRGLPKSHIPQISKNFKDLVTNQILNVTIGNETSDLLITVDLAMGNYSMTNVITFELYKKETLSSGDEVSICYVNEEDGFVFLQLARNLERIDSLQRDIHIESKSATMLTKPHKGLPCLAFFSEDLNWYRCIIVDSLYGAVKVKYVDYGNEEEHTKPQNIKEIKDVLMNILPSQAIPCILVGLEDKHLNSRDIMNRVDGQTFIVTFIEEVKSFMNGIPIKLSKVKLRDINKQRYVNEDLMDLTEPKNPVKNKKPAVQFSEKVSVYSSSADSKLREESYKKEQILNEVPIVPDWLKVCKVTYVESPSLFFVNLIQNENIYRVINENLKTNFGLVKNKSYPSFDVEDQVMIADIKSQDCRYYRAVVVKRTRDSFTVNLVDVGKEQIVSINQVKPLPSEVSLEKYPPQAVKCGVESPSHMNGTEKDFVTYVSKRPVNIHFIRKEKGTWKVAILKTLDMMADVSRGNYTDSKSKTYNKPSFDEKSNRPNWREKDTDEDTLTWRTPNKCSYERSPRSSLRANAGSPWSNSSSSQNTLKDSDGVDNTAERTRASACRNLNDVAWNDDESLSSPKEVVEMKFVEQIPLSSFEAVFVTFLDEDSKLVSVQRKADTDVLNKLNTDIEIEIDSGIVKENSTLTSVGSLCLAQSIEDDLWYRGRVLSIDGENILVQYVDFGNSEILKQTRLRNLPSHLCNPHELRYSCIPQDNDFSLLLNAADEEIIANVVSREESKYVVNFQHTLNAIEESSEQLSNAVEEQFSYENEQTQICANVDEKFDVLEQVQGCVKDSSGDQSSIDASVDQNGSHVGAGDQIIVVVAGDRNSSDACDKNSFNDVGDHIGSVTRAGHNSKIVRIEEVIPPLLTVLTLFISHIEDDGTLWVQLGSNSLLIDELMDSLATLVENEVNLDNIEIGMICSGKYSVDKGWYRAKVISVENEKRECKVLFIDYGNLEIISFNDIKSLPKECIASPSQGIHCSLFSEEYNCLLKGPEIKCSLENFNEMQIEGLFENSDNLELILKHVKINENTLESLILSEISLAINKSEETKIHENNECSNFLVDTNHEFDEEIQNDAFQDGNVSHSISTVAGEIEMESPLEDLDLLVIFVEENGMVWVQDLSQAQQLDSLMEEIQLYVESEEASHYLAAQVDDLCLCLFSQDESYYRAKVLKVKENSVFVHYVDYGNSEDVQISHMYTIAERFASLPFQAIKCSLDTLKDCKDEIEMSIANYLSTLDSIKGKLLKTNKENILIDVHVGEETLFNLKTTFEKDVKKDIETEGDPSSLSAYDEKSTSINADSDKRRLSETQLEYDASGTEEELKVIELCNEDKNINEQIIDNRYLDEIQMEKFAQPLATEILEEVNEVVSSMTLFNIVEHCSVASSELDQEPVECIKTHSVQNEINIKSSDISLKVGTEEIVIWTVNDEDNILECNEFNEPTDLEKRDTILSDTKLNEPIVVEEDLNICDNVSSNEKQEDSTINNIGVKNDNDFDDEMCNFLSNSNIKSFLDESRSGNNRKLEVIVEHDFSENSIEKDIKSEINSDVTENVDSETVNFDSESKLVFNDMVIHNNENVDTTGNTFSDTVKEIDNINQSIGIMEKEDVALKIIDSILKENIIAEYKKLSDVKFLSDEENKNYKSEKKDDDDVLVCTEDDVIVCTDKNIIELPVKLEFSDQCDLESMNKIILQTNESKVNLDEENNVKIILLDRCIGTVNENVGLPTASDSSTENFMDDIFSNRDEDIDLFLSKDKNDEVLQEKTDKEWFKMNISAAVNSVIDKEDRNMQNICTEVESTDMILSPASSLGYKHSIYDLLFSAEDSNIPAPAEDTEEETISVDNDFVYQGEDLETYIQDTNKSNFAVKMIMEEGIETDDDDVEKLDTPLCGLEELDIKVDKSEMAELNKSVDVHQYEFAKVEIDVCETKVVKEETYDGDLVNLNFDERENLIKLKDINNSVNENVIDVQEYENNVTQETIICDTPEYFDAKLVYKKEESLRNKSFHFNHKTDIELFSDNENFRDESSLLATGKCKPDNFKEDVPFSFEDDSPDAELCNKLSNLSFTTSLNDECEYAVNKIGDSSSVNSENLASIHVNDFTCSQRNKPTCMAYKNIGSDNSSISIVQFKEIDGSEDNKSFYIEDVYEIITYDVEETNYSSEQNIKSEPVDANSHVAEDTAESKLNLDNKLFALSLDSKSCFDYESCHEINNAEALLAMHIDKKSPSLCDNDSSAIMEGNEPIAYSTVSDPMTIVKNDDIINYDTCLNCLNEEEMHTRDSTALGKIVVDQEDLTDLAVLKPNQLLNGKYGCTPVTEMQQDIFNFSEYFLNNEQDLSQDSSKDLRSFEGHEFDDSKDELELILEEPLNNNQVSDLEEIFSLGKIVYIDSSPLCLWIQREEDFPNLSKMEFEMKQAISKGLEIPEDIISGHLYASYFYGNLLRARVTSIKDSSLKIFFVDTGRRCCASLDNLYKCPPSLLAIPTLAHSYQLPVHIQEENVPKVVSVIYDRCYNQMCSYTDITSFLRPSVKCPGRHAIVSSKNIGSITDYFITNGLAMSYSYAEILHPELINELSQSAQLVLEESKTF